ncbi:oxidoreductase [Idiomarina abyssalis]|uniref:oxidoreductase n=1 Tax=Idiomarina abyssalis TaxID=86102 RepID=UPI003A945C57
MLSGKTILVLGAQGLIGQAVVQHINEKKGRVIAADVTSDKAASNDVITEACDITSEAEVEHLLNQYPDIDGIVNCAYPRNSQYGTDALEVSSSSFNENVALQLGSCFNLLKYAAKHFKSQQKPLSVVLLSSVYGVKAPDFSIYEGTSMTMPVEYAAVKSGLIHLAKYFAKYINDSNFRVNCLSPGGIENGQPEAFLKAYKSKTLGHGMLSAKDICGSIAFLLSDEANYINGTNLTIDDGLTL